MPNKRLGGLALAVALAGLAVLDVDFGAVHVLARDEVHHARDGVGAVDRARAFLQHFDALDEVDRDHVDVDGGGRAVAEDADAAAVQQHQGALRAQAAQLDVGFTGAAAVVHLRVGRGAGDGRHALHQVAQRRDAGVLDGGLVSSTKPGSPFRCRRDGCANR